MRISGMSALKTKAGAQKVGFFSKMWNPGSESVVVYPVYKNEFGKWDLIVGAVWGHKIDMKQINLKTSFVPSLTEIDERGEPLGTPDITYQFSRISKAFVDGQKANEMARLKEKNIQSDEMRRQTEREILQKYESDYTGEDAVRPAVGGITFKISTECIYIPIVNDLPKPEDARLVAQDISDTRLNQLYALLNSKDYEPDDEFPYLQVKYSFPSGDKKQAGKTAPVGLPKEYRLETRYSEQFKALEGVISTLPMDEDASDMIIRRNMNYKKFTETQIKQALSTYCIMKSEYLDSLSADLDKDTIDRVAKNSRILEDLGIIPILKNESLVEKIKKELESEEESVAVEEDYVVESGVDENSAIITEEMSPRIQELLSQPHLGSDDEIENLNLD